MDVVVAVSPVGRMVVDVAVAGKLASVVTTVVDSAFEDTRLKRLEVESGFSPSEVSSSEEDCPYVFSRAKRLLLLNEVIHACISSSVSACSINDGLQNIG